MDHHHHFHEKCLVGLTSILKKAWTATQDTEDKREKIQALSLAKECYSMKLELLTNSTVVEDAIRFVASESEKSKDHLRLSSRGNRYCHDLNPLANQYISILTTDTLSIAVNS